jgi:transcriptional regulator GlxA family with amidase domain
MQDIAIVLFDDFEPLDVFGPAEVFGCIERLDPSGNAPRIQYCSIDGGMVHAATGATIATVKITDIHDGITLLIPGGPGTRSLVSNKRFLDALLQQLPRFSQILTVCTGSALLAATGSLDGRKATSNKRSFTWVRGVRPEVHWVSHARWVDDGDVISSSGVSAGTDMALSVVSKAYGHEFASSLATAIEYVWNDNPDNDPFAVM